MVWYILRQTLVHKYQRNPQVVAIFQRATVLLLHQTMPIGQRRILESTSVFLNDTEKQTMYKTDHAPAYHQPTTLRLFVDQYHEKYDAACKRGVHKRVTRVQLANQPRTQPRTSLVSGEGTLCKSWEDFQYLKSIYIDVDALLNLKSLSEDARKQSIETARKIETIRTRVHFGTIFKCTLDVHPGARKLRQVKETNSILQALNDELNVLNSKQGDHDHFLSVLTIGGEKEVRLFVNVAKDGNDNDIGSDVFTVAAVLNRLEQTHGQTVHTLGLPNGYIYNMH